MNHYSAPKPTDIKIDQTTVVAVRTEVEKLNKLLSTEEPTADVLVQTSLQIQFVAQLNNLYLQREMGIVPSQPFSTASIYPFQPVMSAQYPHPYGHQANCYPQHPFQQHPFQHQPFQQQQEPQRSTGMRQDPNRRTASTLRFNDGLSILPVCINNNEISFIIFEDEALIGEINTKAKSFAVSPGIHDVSVIKEYLNRWFTYLVVDSGLVDFEAFEDNHTWELCRSTLTTATQWTVRGEDVVGGLMIMADA